MKPNVHWKHLFEKSDWTHGVGCAKWVYMQRMTRIQIFKTDFHYIDWRGFVV